MANRVDLECSICFHSLAEVLDEYPDGPTDEIEILSNSSCSAGGENPLRANVCLTPCGHLYHRVCIMRALVATENKCPHCYWEVNKKDLKPTYLSIAASGCQASQAIRTLQEQLERMTVQIQGMTDLMNAKDAALKQANNSITEQAGLVVSLENKIAQEAKITEIKVADLNDQIHQANADKKKLSKKLSCVKKKGIERVKLTTQLWSQLDNVTAQYLQEKEQNLVLKQEKEVLENEVAALRFNPYSADEEEDEEEENRWIGSAEVESETLNPS